MSDASTDPNPAADRGRAGRPRGRTTVRRAILAVLALYALPVVTGCMNPSVPFDVVYNAGCAPVDPALRAPRDGQVRLVVLQHGLWRSAWALGKLQRSLEALGYRVLNPSYPSTQDTIEGHAARLHERVEAELAALNAPPGELWFVGHSMGGLVIQAYLRRDDARAATGCVFLGTPIRGAVMASQLRDELRFKLLMGTKAARQLAPEDPLHREPLVNLGAVGTVIGGRGDDDGESPDIPGDDDGRVGVDEAHCPGEADSRFLAVDHTQLTISNRAILLVARFLRQRSFDEP